MRKHSFDLVSCMAGLLFVGFAIAYIVGAYTDVRLDPRLVLPLVLVGLGAAGLAASLLAQHRSNRALASADETEVPAAEGVDHQQHADGQKNDRHHNGVVTLQPSAPPGKQLIPRSPMIT